MRRGGTVRMRVMMRRRTGRAGMGRRTSGWGPWAHGTACGTAPAKRRGTAHPKRSSASASGA